MKYFILFQIWGEGGVHALYERIPAAALGWNEGLFTNSVQCRHRHPNDLLRWLCGPASALGCATWPAGRYHHSEGPGKTVNQRVQVDKKF